MTKKRLSKRVIAVSVSKPMNKHLLHFLVMRLINATFPVLRKGTVEMKEHVALSVNCLSYSI
jgi:hypothetical protein